MAAHRTQAERHRGAAAAGGDPARAAGPDRVAADPAAADRIADLCGHLPAPLAASARRLRARPTWTLADLASRLQAADTRLDRLTSGTLPLRTLFDRSYQSLPAVQQRLFRLLALHPGPDATVASAAALGGMPAEETETALEALLDQHMLCQTNPGRYQLHQLLRLHADELGHRYEPPDHRQAAVVRVVEHYLAQATHATRILYPYETRRIAAAAPALPAAGQGTPAEAIAWVDANHTSLVAAARDAATLPTGAALVPRLVGALYRPLANRGYAKDRIALQELAGTVAHRLSDPRGHAQALTDLGTLYGQVGYHADAHASLREALAVWRQLHDPVGEAACLAAIGLTYHRERRPAHAVAYLRRALALHSQAADPAGQANTLNFLGLVCQTTGATGLATTCLATSLAIYQATGHRPGQAIALANLGWTYQRAHRPLHAAIHHRRALRLFRQLGDRYNEAEQLWALGQTHQALDNPHRAQTLHAQALHLLADLTLLTDEEAATLPDHPAPPTPRIITMNT